MATMLQTESTERRHVEQAGTALGRRPTSRRRKVRWIALTIACVGGLFWFASLRVSCGPAEGTALNGAASALIPGAETAEPKTFRVATFNIHGGRGTDGIRDLTRTAACVADCDLIALNEAHGHYFWQAEDQAATLGAALSMPWLFAPAERRWWHFDFGSALVTRLPVTHWQRIPLERTGGKTYRNLLLAAANFNGQQVNIVITHLDSRDPQRRQAQMRAVGDLFLSLSTPALLLGDLNASVDDPQIQRVLSMPGVVDALAIAPGDAPNERIDWIIARGLRSREAGIRADGASDHPCFWAELELAPPAQSY